MSKGDHDFWYIALVLEFPVSQSLVNLAFVSSVSFFMLVIYTSGLLISCRRHRISIPRSLRPSPLIKDDIGLLIL